MLAGDLTPMPRKVSQKCVFSIDLSVGLHYLLAEVIQHRSVKINFPHAPAQDHLHVIPFGAQSERSDDF
jgi:hypothetical protein